MPRLIKGNRIVDDHWHVVAADDTDYSPYDSILLPMAAWLKLPEGERLGGHTAPWIDSGEEFEEHLAELLKAPLIAVHFPVFMDGRGFSTGEILRKRCGYQGELRAFGNLIQDQVFFLKRCGFDSFQLREGTNLESALASLEHFSVTYQTSADTEIPLFRRRH